MTPTRSDRSVLVVDDTPTIHEDFRKILCPSDSAASPRIDDLETSFFSGQAVAPRARRPRFELQHAHQGPEALALVERSVASGRPFQVAFVDMRMPPGWDGVETIRRLWAVDPRIQVVICTAYSDYSWHDLTESLHGTDNLIILKKPFDNIEVIQLAQTLTRKWELARTAENHVADLDEQIRRRTAELEFAQTRFTLAFEASPLAQVIQTLPEGRIVEVNRAYELLFEMSRKVAVGQTPETYPGICDAAGWRAGLARMADGESIENTAELPAAGGGLPRHFRYFARPLDLREQPHCIWIFEETTGQVHLAQQLRQSQKMEAIGQLAAGVAHDFNNVMTAILGLTQLSLDRPNLDSDLRRDLVQVLAAGRRATDLTRQLLIFSRKQVVQHTEVHINALIDEITPLLRRLITDAHELVLSSEDDLPPVQGDRANLEQVIFNLVSNARYAINRTGRIEVRASAVHLDEEDATRHAEARPGDFVCIAVSDNGPGIPPEVLPRIFEPFFTTKPVGEGTGLGLATCYGIVSQLHGWIEVATCVGHGTTFEIFLPVDISDCCSRAENDVTLPAPAVTAPLHASERLLVVEDDALVSGFVCAVLRHQGYTVTLAESAPEALAIWDETGGAFDLVFSDMVMPKGMSGADLAVEILQRRPEVPIILATGYSEALLKESAPREALDHCSIILKPYDSAKLLDAIRGSLETARTVERSR